MTNLFNLLVVFVALALSVTPIIAKDIKGKVVDNASNPLKYVSVYLKNNPEISVLSGVDGRFLLNLPDDVEYNDEDLVLFFHIDYEISEIKISRLKDADSNDVMLFYSTHILDEILVSHKMSKSEQKKHNMSVLEKFVKQASKDFKFENRTYKVASDFRLLNNKQPVFYSKLIGEHKEMIGAAANKKDSIILNYSDLENHMDESIQLGIKRMSDRFISDNVVSKKKRQNKRMLDSTFYEVMLNDSILTRDVLSIHEGFWSFNRDVNERIADIGSSLKRWEIIEGSEKTILKYSNKKGFLGIVKFEMTVNFIVDPIDYSIKQIFENISAEINIPFGYRLPPDALMLLNLIHADEAPKDKYKVRHIHLDATQNLYYKKKDDILYSDEKSFEAITWLTDTKKNTVNIDIKGLLKVLSVVDNLPMAD